MKSLRSPLRDWLKPFMISFSACIVMGFCSAIMFHAIAAPPSQPASLTQQAEQYLQQGNPNAALETWQQAEQLYRQQGNTEGVIGSQINAARALQALGFYRRAKTLLEQSNATLRAQPDSALKVTALINLGNVLRLTGDLDTSATVLQQSIVIAESLQSSLQIQLATFHLANTLRLQEKNDAALALYQQVAVANSPAQFQATLNQLPLLITLKRSTAISPLLTQIEQQLANLPLSQMAVYGQITFAESILQEQQTMMQLGVRPPSPQTLAQHLAIALQQARTLGDRRAESYALGTLGQVYEITHQWQDAERLTRQAWEIAQSIAATDIAYQWRWQMGRLAVAQGDRNGAIAHYTQAFDTLQLLRNDLITINPDVQFSFRKQVEPVYRELVDLLLQDPQPAQAQLQQARQVIESLQLAELTNFFREACLDQPPQSIDQIDPTAAVIYPIILRDRLEVVLSLPGQPLRHYVTRLSQDEIKAGIQRMQQSMRLTAFKQERLASAQAVERWLIQPAIADLTQHRIQTLVFVLDGPLRALPMAALHNGKQYLIERYQVAITPGLQLLPSQSLANRQMSVLFGGMSEKTEDLSALPGVEQEVKLIRQQLPTTVLLNQTFTNQSLASQIKATPFTVLHLASHGRFSSRATDTYVTTWNGRLNVNELQELLVQRQQSNATPLELLVLSACQTARGDERAALGMAGMAIRSGARSTLATLWTVNDASTAMFVTQFYQALTQPGASRAAAIRQAQLVLLKQPKYSHPYFWAPFVLVGNWL